MRSSRVSSTMLYTVLAFALLSFVATGVQAQQTRIVGTDDWPADSLIDPGSLSCSTGAIVWVNDFTPACPGGTLRIRDSLGYGCMQASTHRGAPEPRLTGVMLFEVNARFNASYGGRVWGTWMLVPSALCDPALLEDPEEYWEGTWQGKRLPVCASGQCRWLGALNIQGRGHGGSLQGQRFHGTETIQTLTPLPLPYELLGVCPPSAPCPAEGTLEGHIRK